MRLVFLYGPPGVGKFTIGNALAAQTGFKLFHNHLTVNLVTSLFPPNSEAWNRLAAQIRRAAFTEAAQQGVDLILTRAPRLADQAEVERVRTMIEPVRAAGGSVLFVQLVCDRRELLIRVQREERLEQRKLTDPQVLIEMYDLTAMLPFEPQLYLDVTSIPPDEAAHQIAKHFQLRSDSVAC